MAEKMTVNSVTELPFEDSFFDICVAHGVLDSMPRDIADQGMKEVKRVLKTNALMYLDLVMDVDNHQGDEIVDFGYKKGTIQSYFSVESIKEFLSDFEIIDFSIINRIDENGKEINKRAHLVIKNKK